MEETIQKQNAKSFEQEMLETSRMEDKELRHAVADQIMIDLLRNLGYEAGCKIFEDMKKYYS